MRHLQKIGPVLSRPTRLSLSDSLLLSSHTQTERWSLDGTRLAALPGGDACEVPHVLTQQHAMVFRHPGGAVIARYHTAPGPVRGQHTLSGTSNAVIIRRTRDLAPVARLDLDEDGSFQLSGDGRLLAVSSYSSVTLYRLADRRLLWRLPLGGRAVAFSPDSTRLAVIGEPGACIVPVDSGVPVALPDPRTGAGCRVVFLDEHRLAVTSGGALLTWDGATWSRHSPPDATDSGDAREVWPIAVHGETLAALGPDGCIHLWRVPGARQPVPAPITLPADPADLTGAVICLSGTFTQLDKAALTARIQALGGRVVKSPVRDLTHQVYGLPKYFGPVKESSTDAKVRARIAAGEDIARWSEARLITELIPTPARLTAQLRSDPDALIAWMALLGEQRIAGPRRVNLVDQDLSGLDLRAVPLVEADLHGADLRGCDLSGCDTYRVSLVGADLRGARLVGARIGQASLIDADLRGADLTGARLYGNLLAGARLAGATLTGLKMQYEDLRGCDLSDADLSGTTITDCTWDDTTRWPPGYTPAPARAT
jgi:hypothetical protein